MSLIKTLEKILGEDYFSVQDDFYIIDKESPTKEVLYHGRVFKINSGPLRADHKYEIGFKEVQKGTVYLHWFGSSWFAMRWQVFKLKRNLKKPNVLIRTIGRVTEKDFDNILYKDGKPKDLLFNTSKTEDTAPTDPANKVVKFERK